MKNFVKENWYKLMIGSSMMMTSFGFMIYAISPSYANNNLNKQKIAPLDEGCEYLVDSKNQVWAHVKGYSSYDWKYTGKILQ
jgi:hypothetical protein